MIIDLPPHIEQMIITQASEKAISVGALIEQWAQQNNAQNNAELAWQMGKDLFGTYHSQDGTLSKNAKSLVQQKIQEKYGKNTD